MGFQAGRNASGNHPTWEADPREAEREATERLERLDRQRAEDESRRTTGLAWLAIATEAEIDEARERDEVETRGLRYTDLRDELRRRADRRAAGERAETWARCRAAFADGAILVDDGTPSQQGVYGRIAGQPPSVHYGVRVVEHWARKQDADEANVIGTWGAIAPIGSLAYVADWIAGGRMHVVGPDDVPPEPVVARIGAANWKDIMRVTVGGRTVWAGREHGYGSAMILDEKGRLVRAKAVREGAARQFTAIGRTRG